MISQWTEANGLMRFESFDKLPNFYVYSLAWRFRDVADQWTERLNVFKDNDEKAIMAACDVLPYALSKLDWMKKRFTLISALPSSAEVLPENSGLYRLGHAIATNLSWTWQPYALRKKPHRKIHSLFTAADRDAEVAGKYSVAQNLNADYICILDDFITRGATMEDIVRAIRVHYPNVHIFGITLGKAEKQGYAASYGHAIDNNHVPGEYAARWDKIWKVK